MLVKRSLNSVKMLSVDRDKLFQKLQAIANSIREQHEEVTTIKVFGSFARKDFTGSSDADILIVLSDSNEGVLQRILRFRKFFDLEIPVDVLVYTEDEIEQALAERSSFIMRALEEGVSLR